MSMFKRATRSQLKLRMALCGPSGSGKSYTALRFAFALGPKVAAVDTEHGSLSKYQGLQPDGVPWDFDVVELKHYAPTAYTECIREAARAGYDVLVLDSLSHAWEGAGGALDQVDKKGGNRFTAWKDVTPQHRAMIDAILGSPLHVIATMRTKTEYVLEENEKGKQVPVKIGTQPVQRAGMEYEFDVVADMDLSHTLTVSKTRCSDIDQQISSHPSAAFVDPLRAWLDAGVRKEAATEAATEDAVGRAASPQDRQDAREGSQGDTDVQDAQQPEASGVTVDATGSNDDPYQADERGPATTDQVHRIREVAQQLGMSEARLQGAVNKRGATALVGLRWDKAQDLLEALEKKAYQLQTEAAF